MSKGFGGALGQILLRGKPSTRNPIPTLPTAATPGTTTVSSVPTATGGQDISTAGLGGKIPASIGASAPDVSPGRRPTTLTDMRNRLVDSYKQMNARPGGQSTAQEVADTRPARRLQPPPAGYTEVGNTDWKNYRLG